MVLERLIQKAKADIVAYGTVETINTVTKRLTVKARNDVVVSVTYSPTEFPNLTVGDVVAIGYKGLDRFLVCRVPTGIPVTTSILNV